jgi:sigma-E factor negative regulatory protein RseB
MFRLLFLLLVSFSGMAATESDLWEKINKASLASQNLCYSGILNTVDEKQDINSTRMIHVYHKNEEFLKIEKIDGAPNLLLMHQTDAVLYDNDHDKILIKRKKNARLFPNIFPTSVEKLKENYSIVDGGPFRVANRPSTMFVLSPKDQYRFNYHLWLDDETSLPLKLMVIDNNQKTIENISFANLEFLSNEDVSWFRPNLDPQKKYILNEENQLSQSVRKFWSVEQLPQGFEEVSYNAKRYSGLNAIAHQIVFTDGLSYISVFIHPVPKNQKPQTGSTRKGSNNIHAQYKQGYQIMAVGAVPMTTLTRLTDNVNLSNE